MKTGYDQFFKQARKVASQGPSRPTPVASKPKLKTEEVVANLRSRVQARKNQKRRPFPKKLIIFTFLGVIAASIGMQYADEIDGALKKVEVSLLGEAQAEEKVENVNKGGKAAAEGAAAKADAPQAKKDFSSEEINHFSKLNERKRELDAREEEISRLEQEVAAQKAELDKRLEELEKTRRNIASVLEEKVKLDDQKIDALVQMYSSMKPQQAAKIFETMDEDLAVEIIARMKKKNAAEVMNLVKPEKAQLFSERYAGYKRK